MLSMYAYNITVLDWPVIHIACFKAYNVYVSEHVYFVKVQSMYHVVWSSYTDKVNSKEKVKG